MKTLPLKNVNSIIVGSNFRRSKGLKVPRGLGWVKLEKNPEIMTPSGLLDLLSKVAKKK